MIMLVVWVIRSINQSVKEKEAYNQFFEQRFRLQLPREEKYSPYLIKEAPEGTSLAEWTAALDEMFRIMHDIQYRDKKIEHYKSNLALCHQHLRSKEIAFIEKQVENWLQEKSALYSEMKGIDFPTIENGIVAYGSFQSLIKTLDNDLTKRERKELETLHALPCSCFHLNGDWGVFLLPQVIIIADIKQRIIYLHGYKDLKVTTIDTRRLTEKPASDDEIADITYLYTRRDGGRDMRYSYENNPTYYYVYTGQLRIEIGQRNVNIDYTEILYSS